MSRRGGFRLMNGGFDAVSVKSPLETLSREVTERPSNSPQPTTARTPSLFETALRFNGPVYDPALDDDRLRRQIGRVFGLMLDGRWRSLQEIADATGDPHASISAQLRHLRKPRFGGHAVEKRRRAVLGGTWEYRLVIARSSNAK